MHFGAERYDKGVARSRRGEGLPVVQPGVSPGGEVPKYLQNRKAQLAAEKDMIRKQMEEMAWAGPALSVAAYGMSQSESRSVSEPKVGPLAHLRGRTNASAKPPLAFCWAAARPALLGSKMVPASFTRRSVLKRPRPGGKHRL